jgi:plasmid stability protein
VGQILIRNLDDDLVNTLKLNAKAAGTSLEQYLRDLLAEKVQSERDEFIEFAKGMKERSKPAFMDATEIIRKDRDR